MLTPGFDLLQHPQQHKDYDAVTDDMNNSVESAMHAYLHDQSQSPNSTLPVCTTYTTSTFSPTSSSSSYFASPPYPTSDYYASDNDLVVTTNSLFQSPQLPHQEQHPMLPEIQGPLYYPLTASVHRQQQQQSPMSVPLGLFGHPLLDLLSKTATMDDALYESKIYESSNNITTMDPSLMELLNSPNKLDSNDTNDDYATENQPINLEINSFTDLLQVVQRIKNQLKPAAPSQCQQVQPPPRRHYKKRKCQHTQAAPSSFSKASTLNRQRSAAAAAAMATINTLPPAVKDTVDMFLPTLMEKAQLHWCCVGFKVAPVTLDMICNWRQAPVTIVYCVASIALVTFLDHNADQAYVKTAAMEFYEQARRKMDDVVFDDENDISNYSNLESDDTDPIDGVSKSGGQKVITIQSYFCLSYTSNLLRLYEQQRTWGGLASIALQLRTKDVEAGCRPIDQAILLCYCRWYYVDAWMSLTLGRDCLLPDTPPQFILDAMQSAQEQQHQHEQQQLLIPSTQMTTTVFPREHQSLYRFAMLTKFMRRYIQVIQAGKLVDSVTKRPSTYYYQITAGLKKWYDSIQQQQDTHTTQLDDGFGHGGGDTDAHLHLCYHAMRLVVLYKLLHPDLAAPDDLTLMDGLETNLALLLSLQQLASQGCDQSTYHHMFFAIHNTASRIHQHHTKYRNSKWQKWAKQQLQINLVLLKGTQAYVNDVFQMRMYAEKIEMQFIRMGLQLAACYRSILSSMEQQQSLLRHQLQQQQKYVTHVMNSEDDDDDNDDDDPTSEHKKQQHDNSVVPPIKTTVSIPKPKETSFSATMSNGLPGMHVYKLHTAASIKKPRKVKFKQ